MPEKFQPTQTAIAAKVAARMIARGTAFANTMSDPERANLVDADEADLVWLANAGADCLPAKAAALWCTAFVRERATPSDGEWQLFLSLLTNVLGCQRA